ncbi:hypothetical protein [Phenylobacterium sp.]|jgi:hypothetical protein|uniref:hypothetical protein n=1 Tax=Phenylobacterium sp. TaxID=1871053 RepID=UPI002ED77344
MVVRKESPAAAPQVPTPVAYREAQWESEGGALQPFPAKPFDPTEQPRLYADLLAEADRRRRAADDKVVQGMVAPRYGDL